jgi:hypothetical protein
VASTGRLVGLDEQEKEEYEEFRKRKRHSLAFAKSLSKKQLRHLKPDASPQEIDELHRQIRRMKA